MRLKIRTLWSRLRSDTPLWVYAGISVLILGPLLLPGFILTLDMVFTPQLRLPAEVTSSYLLNAGLHVLDVILPADIIQKLLLLFILCVTGLGGYRLAQQFGVEQKPALYAAGLLYMVNPYSYARFLGGQYNVLFGYALLPWFVRSMLHFVLRPDWRSAGVVAAWGVAISIVSVHSIIPAAIVAALVVLRQGLRLRHDRSRLFELGRYSLAIGSLFLIASSYWLVPVITGTGPQAQFISEFSANDRVAFATGGDTLLERVGNVIRLQGFWAERYGLFILPQDVLPKPLWVLCMVALLSLVMLGILALWRQGRRGTLALLVTTVIVGVVLAAGVGNSWLAAHVPFFAGYREPHKLTVLVAVSYAMLAAIGLAAILKWSSSRKQETLTGLLMPAALALPFLTTPTYLWAAKGQLQVADYPSGWYAVNDRLNADGGDYKSVFLPWHMYMYTNFAGRLIMNPAPRFFDKPVVISDDPEFGGAAYDKSTPASRRLDEALRQAKAGGKDLTATLTALDVRYILLAKDSDYESYDYVDRQPGLERIADYAEISLYRNENHRK